jgi:hypothetical protein
LIVRNAQEAATVTPKINAAQDGELKKAIKADALLAR